MRLLSADTRRTAARARPAQAPARARSAPLGPSPEGARVQAEARLGRSGDALEREAGRAAERVCAPSPTGAPRLGPAAPDAAPLREAGRPCADCGAERAVAALHGPGAPLSAAERAYFEPRFGRSLSEVRLHDTPAAHAAASSIGARAFAVGPAIGFARGLRRPDAPEGRRLLAHEIAHTLQQGAGAGLVQREEGRPNLETEEGRARQIEEATGPLRWLAPVCRLLPAPLRGYCRMLMRAGREVPRDVQRHIVEPYHRRIERETNPNR